jgi:hypothetical protein
MSFQDVRLIIAQSLAESILGVLKLFLCESYRFPKSSDFRFDLCFRQTHSDNATSRIVNEESDANRHTRRHADPFKPLFTSSL